MSSSKTVQKDGLTAYERWELPVVEDGQGTEAVEDNDENIERKLKPPTVEEIEQIQKQAYEEAYKQGYEKGFQSGKAEGLTAGTAEGRVLGQKEGIEVGKKEIEALGEQIKNLLNAMTAPLAMLDEKIEQELIALVIIMTKLLVRRELKIDPGQVVAAVRQGLSALPMSARNIRVHLHPEDAQLIRGAMSIESESDELRWRIVEDPAMTRGGCQIEAEESRLDATVESRLTQIIAQVLGGEREGET